MYVETCFQHIVMEEKQVPDPATWKGTEDPTEAVCIRGSRNIMTAICCSVESECEWSSRGSLGRPES